MKLIDEIRQQASLRPTHPALVVAGRDGTRHISYAELSARVEGHERRLRAAGLAAGDRCGLVARQGAGFIELALGILAADACLVPVPDDEGGPLFAEFARRAHLHHAVFETPEPGFELRRFDAVEAVDGAGDHVFRALAPAYLRFTSGTTSERKGVILGAERITERLDAANRALGIGPEDRILWLLPMAYHFVVSILLYLRNGASILLPASSLAGPVLELGQRERATLLYASPHHVGLLARDGGERGLPELRLAISTAEGLRAEVGERFAARFGIPVSQALGIIEVGLVALNLRAARDKPEAVGRPLPDYQVWLRGEDGRELAPPSSPQHSGEICIRGPGLLDAYLEPWTPAAGLLEPDGFRSGDQGWFDADGDLHLCGRRTNRISMAGMKFFGEEVEAVLDRHPGVRESRVHAQAHAHLGEIPVAEFVPVEGRPPPVSRELAAHCRASLPAYKVPRSFRPVEALPRTSSGKLERRTPSS